MKNDKYVINSIRDAFLALDDILDEEITTERKAKRLKEGASVDVRNSEEVELAKEFRNNDSKKEDTELEVIDVDANTVDQVKDPKSYIGKMLLQCNSCKSTRFLDVDKLKVDEEDPELYNVEDECPHCHNTGTGYTLIGQVGKKEEQSNDEPTFDNDTTNDEPLLDNTEEVEAQEDETVEDNGDETVEDTEKVSGDETTDADDTEDLDLPKLGDEFDVDDVMEDDTEDQDEEEDEDKKKVKKESLNESASLDLTDAVKDSYRFFEGQGEENITAEMITNDIMDNYEGYQFNGHSDDDAIEYSEYFDKLLSEVKQTLNRLDLHYSVEESLDEKLDMSTFEGSIANLIDTFTIEDNPVNVKLLNKNGSELGIYASDDLPFSVKSQMMDTFNTEDNYLEVNVTESKEEGTTVNDLFNYYRPDEDNQTTFVVTNVDTDEEEDFEDLTEFLEKYGEYYIDGALGLRTLNIYITDGDLETEVEPLSDEEVIELGKENVEKEEAEVTEESLIENIIKSYPNLKLNRIYNPLAEEYFIAESIRLNEDLDKVYNLYVKPTNNEKLVENFKSYTGYEDEVDKFLKEHNISKETYNKMINEEVEETNEDVSEDKIKAKIAAIDNQIKELQAKEKEIDNNKSYDTMIDSRSGAPVGKERKAVDLAHNCGQIKALRAQKKELEDLLNEDVEPKEKLLTSVKTRAELGETINKLVQENKKYRISKSLTEGYRYDVFVNEELNEDYNIDDYLCDLAQDSFKENKYIDNYEDFKALCRDGGFEDISEADFAVYNKLCKQLKKTNGEYDVYSFFNENCNEGLFDVEPVDTKDDVEEVEGEIVDDVPSTEVTEPVETTDIVPEGMSENDIQLVQKIDRIAQDICGAIQEAYGVDVSDKKNLVVADIIQDLQLIGGEKIVDDLEDTPINELTKELYQEFNGFNDNMDKLITSEEVPTEQVDKLKMALDSLDGESFETENIYKQIASPKFLEAAQAGNISYFDAQQLQAPVDEQLNEDNDTALVDEDGDIEDPDFNLANETNEELKEEVQPEGPISDYDAERRLGELTYLSNQRELTPDELEELKYCENQVTSKMAQDDLEEEKKPECTKVNLEEFDNCINEYLYENDENSKLYRTTVVEELDESIQIKGIIETLNEEKEVTFTLTPVLNESVNENISYNVTNNLNDLKFLLEM